jgi:hypothetical protein
MDSRRSKIVKKEVGFEQVEDFITEEMVTDGYLKSEAMSLGKRLMVSLFLPVLFKLYIGLVTF